MRLLPALLQDPAPGAHASCPLQSGAATTDPTKIAHDLLSQASSYVIDLDGTLVSGNRVIPGAKSLLDFAQDHYVIVSNNSRDTAITLARKLARLGLKIASERIVLAGEQAIRLVAQRYPGARVCILASPTLTRLAASLGCSVVTQSPDIVVLGRDLHFSYTRLTSVANQLRNGARLIVTNPDQTHPSEDGGITPETGSLMSAVIACTGIEPTCVVGKPEPLLFREALRRLGTDGTTTLVIGDNPLTDGVGAKRLSMRCLLVGQHCDAHVTSLSSVFAPSTALPDCANS
jgi:4-nitrophenyl phosphatase